MELALFVLVGVLALVPLLVRGERRAGLALLVALLAATGALSWSQRPPKAGSDEDPATAQRPLEEPIDGFVGSDACRSCHPGHYETWHKSYHRTMTQVATPETILPDWEGTLSWRDKEYRLLREGDTYWIDMVDPKWRSIQVGAPEVAGPDQSARVRKRVVMTTGAHNQQLFWVTGGDGRKVHLGPFTWLVAEQRWIPYEHSLLRPDIAQEQTEIWNARCIRCHTTGPRPRVDLKTGAMDTRVAELGIACEACHGPGAEHARVNRDPQRRYRMYLSNEDDPTIVHPGKLEARRSSHICAQCHSIFQSKTVELQKAWWGEGPPFRAGDDLEATRVVMQRPLDPSHPMLRDPEGRAMLDSYFWPDGQVRVSGRDYNGFFESPCYEGGEFSCLTCHAMHGYTSPDDQFAPGMDGDAACLQCHAEYADKIEEHTHHKAASAGSRCYNCHMPHTSYGLFKAVRSHKIGNPSVRESVAFGRPNACNLCHVDRSLAWTKEHLEAWYGRKQADVPAGPHRERSAAVVWLLQGDAGQRALAAYHLGWPPALEASGRDWIAPFLAEGLTDSYAAVRFIAGRSLGALPGFEEFAYDYVAKPSLRVRASKQALEAWRARPRGGTRREVFLGAGGKLEEAAMKALRRRRNHRHVELAE